MSSAIVRLDEFNIWSSDIDYKVKKGQPHLTKRNSQIGSVSVNKFIVICPYVKQIAPTCI